MRRPRAPSPEFLEFLAAGFEKYLNAVTRAVEFSSQFYLRSTSDQLETERHNRKIARRAARYAANEAREAGYTELNWDSMPLNERESIMSRAVDRARQSFLEADDIEPEENRNTG